jgi:hypothetical protein
MNVDLNSAQILLNGTSHFQNVMSNNVLLTSRLNACNQSISDQSNALWDSRIDIQSVTA